MAVLISLSGCVKPLTDGEITHIGKMFDSNCRIMIMDANIVIEDAKITGNYTNMIEKTKIAHTSCNETLNYFIENKEAISRNESVEYMTYTITDLKETLYRMQRDINTASK